MENLIIKQQEIYVPKDEVKDFVKGIYIITDEHGNIIIKGHNMIVQTGRDYIIKRCFTDHFTDQVLNQFYIFFGKTPVTKIITPETTYESMIAESGANNSKFQLLGTENFHRTDSTDPGDLANLFKLDIKEYNEENAKADNFALYNQTTLSLEIKRTLVLNTNETTKTVQFNTFGLYFENGDSKVLFSRANCNNVTLNQRRKVIVYYSIRF